MQPKAQPKRDFFISRAGVDAEVARWIAQVLRDAGYSTFLQDDFAPGRSFIDSMDDGIRLGTIALYSPEYFESEYAKVEWQGAFPDRLLPVRIRECSLPPSLSRKAYVDFVGKTQEEQRRLLLKAVGAKEADSVDVRMAKLPAVNPMLIGRDAELGAIDKAWDDPDIRLVSIVAFGGVGKTSLAINWWHRNQARGAKRILGWSFYSQGAGDDRQASADQFLDHALREWFGVSDPPLDSWTRGERLAQLIRRERTLLILDGLEPIQFPPGEMGGRLKDPGMVALLKELAAHSPGLCVCTSRLPLTDLEDYGNAGVLAIDLDNLTPESGAEYLRALKVEGPQDELEAASKEFGNHALALTLLGNFVVKRLHRDIRKRDTIPDIFSAPGKGGHARRVFKAYERLFAGKPELMILRTLGLFDRPADKEALRILRTMSLREWTEAVENLRDARLLFEYPDPEGPLDCHPLVREHFGEEYRAADAEGFREAHAKLYEHYSKQAPDQPDTLEEMQPLFYAVDHGCQAGKHQEVCDDVYFERILRGSPDFLTKSLGAYGVNISILANLFAAPWKAPSTALTAGDQAWVTAQAAFSLKALGRLREGVEPSETSLEAAINQENWGNVASALDNLSEFQLALGDLRTAIDAARRSVDAADRSGDTFRRIVLRTRLADVLHQAADASKAAALFQEAERMQAAWRPDEPLLYSLQGHLYCNLLLDEGRFVEVVRRAKKAIRIAEDNRWLLDIALDHLSLGRASPPGSPEAVRHLDEAVSGLRRAGTLHYVPSGILARAVHYRHARAFDKAQHDLDEVRILATRCGMRLHLTDYHLEQARLFLAQDQPDKAKPHYDKARTLVEETGYHRRDPEVEELARALP